MKKLLAIVVIGSACFASQALQGPVGDFIAGGIVEKISHFGASNDGIVYVDPGHQRPAGITPDMKTELNPSAVAFLERHGYDVPAAYNVLRDPAAGLASATK